LIFCRLKLSTPALFDSNRAEDMPLCFADVGEAMRTDKPATLETMNTEGHRFGFMCVKPAFAILGNPVLAILSRLLSDRNRDPIEHL
jgi:hypothetical protein